MSEQKELFSYTSGLHPWTYVGRDMTNILVTTDGTSMTSYVNGRTQIPFLHTLPIHFSELFIRHLNFSVATT